MNLVDHIKMIKEWKNNIPKTEHLTCNLIPWITENTDYSSRPVDINTVMYLIVPFIQTDYGCMVDCIWPLRHHWNVCFYRLRRKRWRKNLNYGFFSTFCSFFYLIPVYIVKITKNPGYSLRSNIQQNSNIKFSSYHANITQILHVKSMKFFDQETYKFFNLLFGKSCRRSNKNRKKG